ncbi:MAG TPA: VOC family protein [Prosthecobacter sp.]
MAQPRINLVVIRTSDLERSSLFYNLIGINFIKHRHGQGPEHLSADLEGTVFELYLLEPEQPSTLSARVGFQVCSVVETVRILQEKGHPIVSSPKDSPWGRRAVVSDPDGHRVELLEPVGKGKLLKEP